MPSVIINESQKNSPVQVPPPSPVKTDKVKVIYIMGAGRSGSTILGVLLGNMKEYFFAGELHLWNITKSKTFNDRADVVEFWEKVAHQFPDKENYFSYDFDKTLEFHSAIPSLFGFTDKSVIKNFHEQSQKLFTAVRASTGKKITIDSSHYALRAYWLSKNKALDVTYVYVYRDPVDVVYSFQKKNIEHRSKNLFVANAYLLGVSLLLAVIFWTLPKHKKIKIRYEDVLKCTHNTLERIGAVTNVQTEKIDPSNLDTGFIFRSNRIRHEKKISLRREEVVQKKNTFLKYLIYMLHSPFLLQHPRKCKRNL
jgi:hypothetical protein